MRMVPSIGVHFVDFPDTIWAAGKAISSWSELRFCSTLHCASTRPSLFALGLNTSHFFPTPLGLWSRSMLHRSIGGMTRSDALYTLMKVPHGKLVPRDFSGLDGHAPGLEDFTQTHVVRAEIVVVAQKFYSPSALVLG